MSDGVSFAAAVYKIQTLVDGGLRVTLDLPEDAIVQAAWLMECKRHSVVLQITATPQAENDGRTTGETRKIHI